MKYKNEIFERASLIKTVDKSNQGQCAKCGHCCIDLLFLTDNEIKRIHQFMSDNKVKPVKKHYKQSDLILELLSCPFLDPVDRSCMIYDVRPSICHEFICNLSRVKMASAQIIREKDPRFKPISMHVAFLEDKFIKIKLQEEILKMISNLNKGG